MFVSLSEKGHNANCSERKTSKQFDEEFAFYVDSVASIHFGWLDSLT